MLRAISIALIVIGLLMRYLPGLISLRAATKREKLEREAGAEPLV